MADTLSALAQRLQKKNLEIYEKSEEKLVFGKDECRGEILYFYNVVSCILAKPINKPPKEEDYRKINDLINETTFGKHSIKYNEDTKKYDYLFHLEFNTQNVPLIQTIRYAFKAFSLAYDIITCPDMPTAYRLISQYEGSLAQ